MDKKKYIGIVFSLALFAACSSEEGAGVTTEPAGDLDTRLSVLPQEPSAGQKAIMDSILKTMESGGGGTVETENVVRLDSGIVEIDDPSVQIPVPQTAHDFETSGEVYYSRQGCNVTYYEAESGTQMLFTGTSADYMETSLLLTKDEVLIEKVENTYWFEEDKIDCEADLTAFRQRCESLYGVFRDYNDGTGIRRGAIPWWWRRARSAPLYARIRWRTFLRKTRSLIRLTISRAKRSALTRMESVFHPSNKAMMTTRLTRKAANPYLLHRCLSP